MARRVIELIGRWCDEVGLEAWRRPDPARVAARFPDPDRALRPGADPAAIAAWEGRHGFGLPDSLRAWLLLSDGFFGPGPLIHPLSAIGPMVPFARVPGMVVQPESWFEVGNPSVQTICADLGYHSGGGALGDNPIFTSGDDESGSPPRLIASGFAPWFARVLSEGGREFWFDPGFVHLGDPWAEHRRHVPAPALVGRLKRLADRVSPMIRAGIDDRAIAARFAISPFDVEAIARHVQHAPPVGAVGRPAIDRRA